MKKSFLVSLFFIFQLSVLLGQSLKIPAETASLSVIPGEKVFVHYNASMLFAGEYLYFKAYTLNTNTGVFTGLSKIAYIELVGEDGKAVLKQKVILENGLGQGDLFIPTSVPSGNYKLIAYTQWMINDSDTAFFRGDLVLLNPYQGDQRGLTSTIPSTNLELNEDLEEEKIVQSISNKNMQMSFEKRLVGLREKVAVKLRGTHGNSLKGNFSVSVRKTESEFNFPRPLATELNEVLSNSEKNKMPSELFLPELRGDLLVGQIKGANEILSVAGKVVAVYIPGEDHIFKTARTDEMGLFFINLGKEYTGDRILAQVVGDAAGYDINLFQDPDIKHSSLNFTSFFLNQEMEQMIVERSIYNQIENAYYGVKPDTITETERSAEFYGKSGMLYNLDEFTRFPTIRETFLEIISSVRIANNGAGEPEFRLRPPEGTPDIGLETLLVVDGLLVQDHQLIIEYPAHRVKSIRVIREKYYNGPLVFQGVIAVETVDGNFYAQRSSPLIKEFDLARPQPVKKYFRQTYDETSKNNRIPDFRYQLAWIPDLETRDSESEFWFFTSDIPGYYEVSIEGFFDDGTPVSLKEYFNVE